jgi:hypothetical protein
MARPVGPINVRELLDWLVLEHGYTGSYKPVLRHVRAKFPQPKLRPFRRVETPPGAQAQVDWWECSGIYIGDLQRWSDEQLELRAGSGPAQGPGSRSRRAGTPSSRDCGRCRCCPLTALIARVRNWNLGGGKLFFRANLTL